MIGRVRALVWRELAGAAAGVAGGMLAGLTVRSSLVLGVAGAVLVVLGLRLSADPDPARGRERYVRPDGGRGDLQDLAWAVVGNDGRAGERVLRRLRAVAGVRLARHGVSLPPLGAGDGPHPEQVAAVRALLGDRAVRTLTRLASPRPSVADVEHTLAVLERLGTHPPTEPAEPVDLQDGDRSPRRPRNPWRTR